MATQCEWVLAQLKGGRALTTRDAFVEQGITRLSARIYDLRQQGYPIRDRDRKVPSRTGGETTVSEYYLPQGQLELEL